jgi:hypothetical protein
MSDIYDTETREHHGASYLIEWAADHHHGLPWEESDCHGEVSEWTRRDKKPGERILNTDRHGFKRFYDVQASMQKARTVWGFTNGKEAAEAVEKDFEYLRAWCEDRWFYCGIIVTLLDEDGDKTDVQASLWGIESDAKGYHASVIMDLIGDCEADRDRQVYAGATVGEAA